MGHRARTRAKVQGNTEYMPAARSLDDRLDDSGVDDAEEERSCIKGTQHIHQATLISKCAQHQNLECTLDGGDWRIGKEKAEEGKGYTVAYILQFTKKAPEPI
ncbi:MAG: hypothetical protein FRX49_09310 [Trebouxia sp. A1-2]|nr:MAG: hypothetical protein FRX49_09310 [Trebouxia sp. A1-2]